MFFLVAMHFEQAINHRKFPAIMWLVFCGFRSYHVSNSSTVAVITNCPMWWMWVWPGRCEKYQRDHRFEFSRLCKWNSLYFVSKYLLLCPYRPVWSFWVSGFSSLPLFSLLQRTVFPKDYYVVHRYTRHMLCDTDPVSCLYRKCSYRSYISCSF